MLEPNANETAVRNLVWLKGRKFQKYNLLKFRVICAVMDYMAFMNGATSSFKPYKQEHFPESDIRTLLTKTKLLTWKRKKGELITIQ